MAVLLLLTPVEQDCVRALGECVAAAAIVAPP
jgi:hypothetical protein